MHHTPRGSQHGLLDAAESSSRGCGVHSNPDGAAKNISSIVRCRSLIPHTLVPLSRSGCGWQAFWSRDEVHRKVRPKPTSPLQMSPPCQADHHECEPLSWKVAEIILSLEEKLPLSKIASSKRKKMPANLHLWWFLKLPWTDLIRSWILVCASSQSLQWHLFAANQIKRFKVSVPIADIPESGVSFRLSLYVPITHTSIRNDANNKIRTTESN